MSTQRDRRNKLKTRTSTGKWLKKDLQMSVEGIVKDEEYHGGVRVIKELELTSISIK